MKNDLTVEETFDLAVKSYQKNKFHVAEKLYKEILKTHPNHAGTYVNLGMTLNKLEKYKEATYCYERAIKINPNDSNPYYNLGNLYKNSDKYEEAINFYNNTIQVNPNHSGAYNNLGNIFIDLGEYKKAIKCYTKAIQVNPNNADVYNNLGLSYRKIGKPTLAVESFSRAFKINPNLDNLLGSLIHSKNYIIEWKSFDKDLEELADKIVKKNRVCTPLQSLLLFDSPKLQSIATQIYVKEKYSDRNDLITVLNKKPNNKIRIGYFSADFRNHAVSFLLANLYELHDKSKFELIAFSFGPEKKDEMYYRISTVFDQFINVRLKSDDDVTKLSRELKIDIAVDLMTFTQYNRFGIFTKRCAPIQVNYLGYSGTSGAKCIDYIIADKTTIPKKNQKYYSEKIVYMPDTYMANDSTKKISNKVFTREELGLPIKGFVFCCFNQMFKLNPEIFDIWMNLLKRINNSVLWVSPQNEAAVKNLQKEAALRNVDPKRIIFAQRMKKMSYHLARYKAADLFIDTFPCTAQATASDALWAGLPVLTRIGESFVSRVPASLLNAIELSELVTYTKKEYENKAIELANNPMILKEIKNKLNKNRHTKPLFNTKLFTKNLEMAYLKIYEKYVNNKKPSNIEIK